MYLCVGTFLTALKICKASSVKQKELGSAVFTALYPKFNCGDDDSAISAVFRGKRNLNSYLQIMMDDIEPEAVVLEFKKRVLPLLDENKNTLLVRLLQELIRRDSIDNETHVELINRIKKKNLIQMDKIVLGDFLVGVLLYVVRYTDNLNQENEVKSFRTYALKIDNAALDSITFIQQYSASRIFDDDIIRPVNTLYKQACSVIDVICADIFDVKNRLNPLTKINIVIPVNTTFETRLEEKFGDVAIPLVSETTIHGQWLERLRRMGLKTSNLDNNIEKNLKSNGFAKCGTRGTEAGKQDVYPMASLAIVIVDNVRYFLLALSEFDKNNKAISNVEYIKKAIATLITFYDMRGQGFDLYIPLLGSGRSRTGMSLQESYDLLKEMLLERENEIYGRVHIVIHPSQMTEIKLEGI